MKLRAARDSSYLAHVSDRLKELQRQRALVQEQLAWLDQEIATLQGSPVTEKTVPVVTVPLPVQKTPAVFSDAAAAEQAAEEILAQYKQEGESLQSSVKRGCFLYFFIALALLGLGVFALYLFRSSR